MKFFNKKNNPITLLKRYFRQTIKLLEINFKIIINIHTRHFFAFYNNREKLCNMSCRDTPADILFRGNVTSYFSEFNIPS